MTIQTLYCQTLEVLWTAWWRKSTETNRNVCLFQLTCLVLRLNHEKGCVSHKEVKAEN